MTSAHLIAADAAVPGPFNLPLCHHTGTETIDSNIFKVTLVVMLMLNPPQHDIIISDCHTSLVLQWLGLTRFSDFEF